MSRDVCQAPDLLTSSPTLTVDNSMTDCSVLTRLSHLGDRTHCTTTGCCHKRDFCQAHEILASFPHPYNGPLSSRPLTCHEISAQGKLALDTPTLTVVNSAAGLLTCQERFFLAGYQSPWNTRRCSEKELYQQTPWISI